MERKGGLYRRQGHWVWVGDCQVDGLWHKSDHRGWRIPWTSCPWFCFLLLTTYLLSLRPAPRICFVVWGLLVLVFLGPVCLAASQVSRIGFLPGAVGKWRWVYDGLRARWWEILESVCQQVLGAAGAETSTETGNGKKWPKWWPIRLYRKLKFCS